MDNCNDNITKYVIVQPGGSSGSLTGATGDFSVCSGTTFLSTISGCTDSVNFNNNTFYNDGSVLFNSTLTACTGIWTSNIYGCSPITVNDNLILLSGLTFSSITEDNSLTQILSRDGVDGSVKYRDVNSIIGAASADTYVSGFIYDDINTFTITRNDGTAFTQTINILSATTISATTFYGDGSNLTGIPHTTDTFVTGGTYNASTVALDFSGNTGFVPFSVGVLALKDDTNTYVTGNTYTSATNYTNQSSLNLLYQGTATGGPYSLSSEDTFVTGSTLSGDTLVLSRNDGDIITTDLSTLIFTGNTSASCITDLYITNLYGCSPITVHDSIQSINSSATGTTSFAFGNQVKAYGKYSTASGYYSTASGDYSSASGYDSTASGYMSYVRGNQTTASASYATADGSGSIASGFTSHAEGKAVIAGGNYSHAEGYNTKSFGVKSHAEGTETTASGEASHAQGGGTTASGDWSHAEGLGNVASGNGSHAEGGVNKLGGSEPTSATTFSSHAEGIGTVSSGNASHAEGNNTTASGAASHAEGQDTKSIGQASHAEGFETTASGGFSTASGYKTTASGEYSSASGYHTTASGYYGAHAEGGHTTASGDYSHAEGGYTTASGGGSHSQGINTTASGDYSHASGKGNKQTLGHIIIASGETSFVHFKQTSTSGSIGAFGDYSTILGGTDHNIDFNATSSGIFAGSGNTVNNGVIRSVVLGGSGISATTSNMVYVPNLNINTIPGNDNSLTQILSRDSSDGSVKYRDVSSIIGAASADTYVISGNANASNSTLTFTNNSGSTFTVTNSAALFSDNDINVTGGTYNPSDGCVTFATNSGTTFEVCGFLTGFTDNDNYVTGGTLNSGTLTLNRQNGLVTITGFTTDLDTYVTGGTISVSANNSDNNGTIGLLYKNSDGIPRTLPFEDTFTTGGTYDNSTALITFKTNSGSTYTVDLSTIDVNDTFVTGGTYNPATVNLDFSGNTGFVPFSVDVSSLKDDTNTYVTGNTYTSATDSTNQSILNLLYQGTTVGGPYSLSSEDTYITGTTFGSNQAVLTRNDGTEIFKLSGSSTVQLTNPSSNKIFIDVTIPPGLNTYVTGFTYNNANTFTIFDNAGDTFSASINEVTGLTVNGSVSATTYYGDGSNLTGISTDDNYVTGGTFSSGTLTLDRQNGSVTVTGFTTDTNTTVTGYTYNDANTFTISNSDGSNYSASINTMTGLTINGDLNVNGESVFSGNSTDVVQIYGSGSTSPIFRIQGSSGELFSVTDSLVGELFAVNDISGIPILQVYSDNRIILGDNLAPSLYTTAKVTASSGSSTSIYSVPVSAYTGAWFEYTANDGTNLRGGNIASIFTASDVNHNETTTTDIGNTNDLIMDVSVSGGNATLTASATTSNWEIKTIIRSI